MKPRPGLSSRPTRATAVAMTVTLPRYVNLAILAGLLATGCATKIPPADPTGEAAPPAKEAPTNPDAERPSMTAAECEASGGRVVGDIGDGAIHRPDYTCEGGKPPTASVRPAEGEPVAIEGAVCCPPAA